MYDKLAKVRELLEAEQGDASHVDAYTIDGEYPPDSITLQFFGWSIVLLPDGKWFWMATDGG